MVTSASDAIAVGRDSRGATRNVADRWIFVFMAALFVGTALAGFIPTSLARSPLSRRVSGRSPRLCTFTWC